MIRRLKKDVLKELPPKMRQIVEVECDKDIIKKIRSQLGNMSTSIGATKNSKKNVKDKDKGKGNTNIGFEKIENLEELLAKGDGSEKDEDVKGGYSEAYALTGRAKLTGIKDYILFLLESKSFLSLNRELQVSSFCSS